MNATNIAKLAAPTLHQFAHQANDSLFDVLALLSAVEDRLDRLGGAFETPLDQDAYANSTLRLAQMARAKVQAAVDALSPHV